MRMRIESRFKRTIGKGGSRKIALHLLKALDLVSKVNLTRRFAPVSSF